MSILTVTLHPAIDKVLKLKRLAPNDIARSTIEMLYCGGKGNNAARALVGLGEPTAATGFQGGHNGRFASESLESEGVKTAFVECVAPTRTSLLIHEEDTGFTYAIYEPGQAVTEKEAANLVNRFKQLLADHPICLFCGSGQSPLLEKIYAQCIQIARENQVITLLDSSGKSLTNAIAAKPYLVKVNVNELSDHCGRPLRNQAEQLQALSELCQTGIQIAALSRGEEGLLLTDGQTAYEASLKMDHILNVVGCGDSTLAGIAKSIKSGHELSEMARWGVACGTANTQRKGAGFIDLDLVQSLLPKVKISKIELK